MPVYKRPGADTYSFDFRLKGARYSGNTGCTTKREAERFEEGQRKAVKALIADGNRPMSMERAIVRYWEEVGQHHRNADTTLRDLAWLEREVGKPTAIGDVSSNTIARLVAKRRLPDQKGKVVSPATVNRSVVQPMRAILARAKTIWGQSVQDIVWKHHLLKEPQERVRELSIDEEAALFAALRADYHPIVRFALLTGCRMQECLDLEWRHIDWHIGELRVTGKGSKTRIIPMSRAMTTLLKPLPRAHGRVFTYESRRADNTARGALLPIAREALKSIFERTIDKAGIVDFHFHDLRHTCATRLLRATGNLRLAQDLLGHEDLETTRKYAHVTRSDLRSGLDAMDGGVFGARSIIKADGTVNN